MDMVIFDLETTGLSAARDEIIQIAAVRMRSGRILETEFFATYVKPPIRIPHFITRYTGITETDVREAPSVQEALPEFSKFVGDATLVAHNGQRFDMPFIREACARHNLNTRPVNFVDSIAFSRAIWGGRGGHGLDNVMARLGISTGTHRRHDACGDVRLLAQAVQSMWNQLAPGSETCPLPGGLGVMPE